MAFSEMTVLSLSLCWLLFELFIVNCIVVFMLS